MSEEIEREISGAQSALRDAERMLVEKELIRVEMIYRADLERGKPILEKFISTDYLFVLMRAFSGDFELSRFRIQTQRAYDRGGMHRE